MKKKALQRISAVGALILFGGAAFILQKEIRSYGLERIGNEVGNFSAQKLAAVAAIAALIHVFLTCYDWLGFRYLRYSIAYRRVMFSALAAYTFGNNIGLANFAGAAVRFRIYSKWGINPRVIAQVIGLDVLSNWLGFLLATGLVFTFIAPIIPLELHAPIHTTRPLGLVFLALFTLYFTLSTLKPGAIRLSGKLRIPMPRGRIFLTQVAVGCGDFLVGGLPLYLLLPSGHDLSYPTFLGFYLLGQGIGIISHVPGALGIFETIMLLSLRNSVDGAQILAALLAFRIIYFLLPLAVTIPAYAWFELRHPKSSRENSVTP